MAEVPGLSSLRVVPLMHAMYGPAGIVVLPDGSRLFDGTDRGDMEEGLPQGSPESSAAFWHFACSSMRPSPSCMRPWLVLEVALGSSWILHG